MAVTSNQSGSQTAVINTEHQLGSNITSAGTYQLVVDTAAMVGGDTVELRIYSKARSGDTERVAYSAVFQHTQPDPWKASIALATDCHFKATLRQTAGTGRAFPWNILSLA